MTLRAIARADKTDTQIDKLFVGLHGWGANAQDLAALADYLALPGYYMIFPDAPISKKEFIYGYFLHLNSS
ncbi:MAG: hypothetical protein F6K42_20595 [Leptolyngbya sp. SIO1D8]|nr:hypothetical protein [Leptolyngbya sp. SIO1D8]